MSEELDDLLRTEGIDDVEGLMSWAHERAQTLISEAESDPELRELLNAGGTAGPVTTTPRARKEPSSAAPLPPIPSKARAAAQQEEDEEEIEELDIEELDVEELELIEDEEDEEEDDEGETSTALPKMPPESPTYGPPDGTEDVPEWKAALMSTQTQSDAEAAARVKEASSAEPLPTAPEVEEDDDLPTSQRLEAEDDEISQHSIDFSDLDLDDE